MLKDVIIDNDNNNNENKDIYIIELKGEKYSISYKEVLEIINVLVIQLRLKCQ